MRITSAAFRFYLLTAWLLASMTSLPASAWTYVPAGWTATEPGYWGTEQDGRDTLQALRTYRESSEAWEKAYNALHGEFDTLRLELDEKFASLKDSLDLERKAWKGEVRKAKGPGWGVFIGYGVDQQGNGTPAVGVGLVWKF